jgi:hypothetical protein
MNQGLSLRCESYNARCSMNNSYMCRKYQIVLEGDSDFMCLDFNNVS